MSILTDGYFDGSKAIAPLTVTVVVSGCYYAVLFDLMVFDVYHVGVYFFEGVHNGFFLIAAKVPFLDAMV